VALLDGVAERVVEHRPLAPLGRPGRRLPVRVRAQAASASRTVAVSSNSATGSEARSAQSRAAAILGGGSVLRVAGLNAQANSACRSTFGSGVPGSLVVRAMVTVSSASATDRRETGVRFLPLGLGVGAGVLVPGHHLPLCRLGFRQAGAGVEGPPVTDGVLQVGEEPVREGAGFE
jgi:hypothetical protein